MNTDKHRWVGTEFGAAGRRISIRSASLDLVELCSSVFICVHLWFKFMSCLTRARCCSLLVLLLVLGCSTAAKYVPQRLAGQVPPDYRLGNGRGVMIARFTVSTQGTPGFGAITNPLIVQFHQTDNPAAPEPIKQNPQGLTFSGGDARVWTSERTMPTLWEYRAPGLMAASFAPAVYDGVVIAYPDAQKDTYPDSIPAPSQPLAFAPITLPPDAVVYIGHIHIRQSYGLWDRILDRVNVDYAVTDDYDTSVAEFRAQYPQFRDTPVEKRLVQVAAQ
jgi:hypothetical protein